MVAVADEGDEVEVAGIELREIDSMAAAAVDSSPSKATGAVDSLVDVVVAVVGIVRVPADYYCCSIAVVVDPVDEVID